MFDIHANIQNYGLSFVITLYYENFIAHGPIVPTKGH